MQWDQSVISRIESGEREPTADFAIAVAKTLQLEPNLVLAKAGLADEPLPVNEQSRAELMSVFDRLSDEDQVRLIEMAKGLEQAERKLGGSGKRKLKGA